MVHVFSEHLSPVEKSAANQKNRRAQRFGELQAARGVDSCICQLACGSPMSATFLVVRDTDRTRDVVRKLD